MSANERIKRPELERTSPERRWNGVFEPRDAEADARSEERPPADGDFTRSESTPYEAVNGAYRVIDEYMRQGQKMAEEFWLPLSGGSARDVSRVFERFMRAAGDMGMAWVEMMSPMRPPSRTESPKGSAGPFATSTSHPDGDATSGRARSAEPTGLSVSIESSRRVEVTVDLRGGASPSDLALGALTALDSAAAPLGDVKLEPDEVDGHVVVRIRVPENQASGVYNGILLDRSTSRPRGTVSLVVR
jgi:hypothetical protein